MVNVIAAHYHVDGRVQLDAGDFRAAQLLHVVDVVNFVVFNEAEHRAHAAHDARLFAVVNFAPAHDVAAHLFLQPAMILAPADGVPLHLSGAFHMLAGKIMIVFRVQIFPQGNAAALAAGNIAILDDPALGPVGADHAVLIRRGRRPGGGGLADPEAGEGDVIHAGFRGHEAIAAHVDFHLFLIGILPLEIGVNHRLMAFLASVPFINGPFRLPGGGVNLAPQAFLQGFGFIQLPVVQINRAGMPHQRREVPVPADNGGIGIIPTEHAVVHPADPGIALVRFPIFDLFRAGNQRAQGFLAAVHNARVRLSRKNGVHRFPINARGHDDLIAGPGDSGRVVDPAKGHFPGTAAFPAGGLIHINLHKRNLPILWKRTAVSDSPPYRTNRFYSFRTSLMYCREICAERKLQISGLSNSTQRTPS